MQGINFHPNLKGTGQAANIGIITGTIDLEEDTASKYNYLHHHTSLNPLLTTAMLDIWNFRPVVVSQETNEALNIQVIPQSDTISLELDDRMILRFTPSNPALTPETFFAETGEFRRDITAIHIMDDDSESMCF